MIEGYKIEYDVDCVDGEIIPLHLPRNYKVIVHLILQDIEAVNSKTSKDNWKKKKAELKHSIETLEQLLTPNKYIDLLQINYKNAKGLLKRNKELYKSYTTYSETQNVLLKPNLQWLAIQMWGDGYTTQHRNNAVYEIFKIANYKDYATGSASAKLRTIDDMMREIIKGEPLMKHRKHTLKKMQKGKRKEEEKE